MESLASLSRRSDAQAQASYVAGSPVPLRLLVSYRARKKPKNNPGGRHEGKLLSFDVSLRFAVGARVECARGGTWAPGRVIKLHYHEESFEPGFFAPYQIRLDNGTLIYAPDDDDNWIREAT